MGKKTPKKQQIFFSHVLKDITGLKYFEYNYLL